MKTGKREKGKGKREEGGSPGIENTRQETRPGVENTRQETGVLRTQNAGVLPAAKSCLYAKGFQRKIAASAGRPFPAGCFQHPDTRWQLPALLLALLLLLPGCKKKTAEAGGADDAAAAPVAVELMTAKTQTIDATVSGQGILAPGQGATARVAASVAGRITQVLVREGDRVKAGQIIAIVDNRPQQAQEKSAGFALTTSEAQARQSELTARAAASDQQQAVKAAQAALDAAKVDRANAVRGAITALKAAQTDEARVKAGARPQEIAQSVSAVAQADATRKRAQTERDRVQFLFDKGIAPRRQLDDAETALTVAEAALTAAQQAESLIRAGARPEELRAAELRTQQAQEAFNAAETGGDAKVRQAEAALEQARKTALTVAARNQDAIAANQAVAQKRADLSAARATAQYAQVRAPLSGVVSRRMLGPGDMADVTIPILEITNPTSVNLVANLTAEDGRQVRPGMPAKITPSDAPEISTSGQVISVGQVDPATNLLSVRIAINGNAGRIKAGEFATAEITVRHAVNVVAVPKQAIVTREEKSVVYAIDGENTAHQKEVKIGAEQNGNVEILSGLKAGEKIAKLGQYELSDGAKVKEAEKEAPEAAASKEP